MTFGNQRPTSVILSANETIFFILMSKQSLMQLLMLVFITFIQLNNNNNIQIQLSLH